MCGLYVCGLLASAEAHVLVSQDVRRDSTRGGSFQELSEEDKSRPETSNLTKQHVGGRERPPAVSVKTSNTPATAALSPQEAQKHFWARCSSLNMEGMRCPS